MVETKFTPGPWMYGPAHNYHGFYVAPTNTLPTLAAVVTCGQNIAIKCHNFPGSTEANARLIAAAPELYKAANEALELLLGGYSTKEGREYLAQDIEDARRLLEAALAKAVRP
jgi:hypothetical protein